MTPSHDSLCEVFRGAKKPLLFIGNGILRVPCTIGDGTAAPLLSWEEYMWNLWSKVEPLVEKDRPGNHVLTDYDQFAKLSAPRQAEFFDRMMRTQLGDPGHYRLKSIAGTIHKTDGIVTNDIIKLLSSFVVTKARACFAERDATIDIITTNVDCTLEQNIAMAIERGDPAGKALPGATIEIRAGLARAVTWRREAAHSSHCAASTIPKACLSRSLTAHWEPRDLDTAPNIRLWKLHGCVRRSLLPRQTGDTTHGAVFAISEYVAFAASLFGAAAPETTSLTSLKALLHSRPILFVGYDLAEVDVDIVSALTLWKPEPEIRRATLKPGLPRSDPGEAERLMQMGVEWWGFALPPLASYRKPGDFRRADKLHDWRVDPNSPQTSGSTEDWNARLALRSAELWLEAQYNRLAPLVDDADRPVRHTDAERSAAAANTSAPPAPCRLVVVGEASIWHGFALRPGARFPVPRRASAGMASVDVRVPGGTGLVPAMTAAVLAGPERAGQCHFYSTAPPTWSSWPEIEEFCLSAGVNVMPTEGPRGMRRTSHILFFPAEKRQTKHIRPRQRFIMDVDSHGAPLDRACLPKEFRSGPRDILYIDKKAEPSTQEGWQGLTFLETGTDGVELDPAYRTRPPNIWSAALRSFLKTLSVLRAPGKRTSGALFRKLNAKYSTIDGWDHAEEVAVGHRLCDKWPEVTNDWLWPSLTKKRLAPHPDWAGGLRGVLVTAHEAGLVSAWEHGKTRQTIVCRIEHASVANGVQLAIKTDRAGRRAPFNATISGRHGQQLELRINDQSAVTFGERDSGRWNTLAAGDSVRGCLLYGLRELVDDPPKSDEEWWDRLTRAVFASCVLATAKCFSGSLVSFLRLLSSLPRTNGFWESLWGITARRSKQPESATSDSIDPPPPQASSLMG